MPSQPRDRAVAYAIAAPEPNRTLNVACGSLVVEVRP